MKRLLCNMSRRGNEKSASGGKGLNGVEKPFRSVRYRAIYLVVLLNLTADLCMVEVEDVSSLNLAER